MTTQIKNLKNSQKLDVVFVLDSTGSMHSWIERSKKTICFIATSLEKQGIDARFIVVAYKDVCDRHCDLHVGDGVDGNLCPVECPNSEWIQISDLTKNPEIIKKFLETVYASGGGDMPEDMFGAIQAIKTLSLRDDAKKVAVVISDAPPHGKEFCNDYDNTPTYPLPYKGSEDPKDIASYLIRENIEIFMLYVADNVLEKTTDFLRKMGVSVRTTSLTKDPWKFSLILQDNLAYVASDVASEGKEDEDLIDGTGDSLCNAFFQIRRGLPRDKLQSLLEYCFKNGMKDAVRLALYCRDRTGDIKEKDLGRNAFDILKEFDPSFVSKYLKEFVQVGCVNDLLHLSAKANKKNRDKTHPELIFFAVAAMNCYLKYINTDEGQKIIKSLPKNRQERHIRLQKCLNTFVFTRLKEDEHIGIPPYFLYKWLPKFTKSKGKKGRKKMKWECNFKFASIIANLMFLHPEEAGLKNALDTLPIHIHSRQIIQFISEGKKENPEKEALYRELYSFLRELCETLPVEVHMCARDWEEKVDPAKATAGAQLKYKKAFAKKLPEKLKEAITNRKIKATTLQGHQMVSHFIHQIMSKKVNEEQHQTLENDLVNSQWDAYFKENEITSEKKIKISFQLDCSGSMLEGTPEPLTLAITLFLLSGLKRFISFSQPGWCNVEGTTLGEQVASILGHHAGVNGDIPGGLKLVMEQKEQPVVHFVLTDGKYPRMNIKEAIDIRNKLNKGPLTQVVILNLRTGDDELLFRRPSALGGEGFYIISGHSPVLIKLFTSGKGTLEDKVRKLLRDKYPLKD